MSVVLSLGEGDATTRFHQAGRVRGNSSASRRARSRRQPSVVGFLGPGSPEGFANLVTALGKGLSEAGYVEGQNVSIEARWAYNRLDQLPALAAELVGRHVAVIATSSVGGVEAAKRATTTIPILFGFGGDPVQLGIVAKLNRPGGNSPASPLWAWS